MDHKTNRVEHDTGRQEAGAACQVVVWCDFRDIEAHDLTPLRDACDDLLHLVEPEASM